MGIPMRLPDGTILLHARAPYDPIKAHQYYLRTRQLKGRRNGQTQPLTRRVPLNRNVTSPLYSVKLVDGQIVNLTKQQLAEQQSYATERVKQVKQSLKELSTKLREAMAEAKAEKAKAEREAAKPKTAAEKSEAARESEKYRERHKTELATKARTRTKTASKSKSENTDPVAELEVKVSQIKDSLKAAVAMQRSFAEATKNG